MLRCCCLLLALLPVTLLAHQGQPSDPAKTLVLGVQNHADYLPYSEYRDGEYRGFNRALFELFAAHGYPIAYRPLPIKRLYREQLAKEIDLKYPDNPYWSSRLKGDAPIIYSAPVIEFTDGVMVHPRNLERGLPGLKRLGVVLGFTPKPYQSMIDTGALEVIESPSYDKLLRQVQLGRIDGMYGNIAVARHRAELLFEESTRPLFDPRLPNIKSTRHLSSLQHPAVVDAFNRFLNEHQEEIEKLKREHQLTNDIPAE